MDLVYIENVTLCFAFNLHKAKTEWMDWPIADEAAKPDERENGSQDETIAATCRHRFFAEILLRLYFILF